MDFKAHHDIQTLGNEIKNIVDEHIRSKRNPEEIIRYIQNLCLNCLEPKSTDCEICNGYMADDIQNVINLSEYDREIDGDCEEC